MSISEQMRDRVRRRARNACEYCRLPQSASVLPHQVDHIIARQHMGSEDEDNLCLCCLRCNLKKGPNIASTDPEGRSANRIVTLFHPRQQRWHKHFRLREGGRIEGLGRLRRHLHGRAPPASRRRELPLRRRRGVGPSLAVGFLSLRSRAVGRRLRGPGSASVRPARPVGEPSTTTRRAVSGSP